MADTRGVSHRGLRFAAWVVAVGSVCAGPAIVHTALPHRRTLAAAWVLAHLTAIAWMLSRPARGAIRLPALLSEAIVLGATPALLNGATGSWGPGAALALALLAMNHVSARPVGVHLEPGLGNAWRLAPALWHPALWLVALHAPGTARAWLGVGLVPAALCASVLARSPSRGVRAIGWAVWAAAGAVTVVALW